MLRRVAEQLSEIRMQGVGIQLHAVPSGVAGLLEELLGFGRIVVAEPAPFDRIPFADRGEMEGEAGLHAVGRAARGPLDLASVGYGQDRRYIVELFENVGKNGPHIAAGQFIGAFAALFGVHVHVFRNHDGIAEVDHDAGVEAGAIEAGVGHDAVVAGLLDPAFVFAELGDDLVAAVDARVGDVPHADRERKVGVHAVDEETARGVAVLSVVRQHVQLGLVAGGPFVAFHGPVGVVEQGVEVQLELLGRLEPGAAGRLVPGRKVKVAARNHKASGQCE